MTLSLIHEYFRESDIDTDEYQVSINANGDFDIKTVDGFGSFQPINDETYEDIKIFCEISAELN